MANSHFSSLARYDLNHDARRNQSNTESCPSRNSRRSFDSTDRISDPRISSPSGRHQLGVFSKPSPVQTVNTSIQTTDRPAHNQNEQSIIWLPTTASPTFFLTLLLFHPQSSSILRFYPVTPPLASYIKSLWWFKHLNAIIKFARAPVHVVKVITLSPFSSFSPPPTHSSFWKASTCHSFGRRTQVSLSVITVALWGWGGSCSVWATSIHLSF
jgi:hypothetical protein